MTEAKVLVVDDEVEMLTLLRSYLSREGYAVKTAPSAETALQLLEEHDFDVVLTDLRMRGMSGLELLQEIRAARPETQIILMTAFGSIETAIEAIKAGAYHFVTKPVKLPELGVLVRKALSDRDLHRENRQLRQAVAERYAFGQLLGKSAVMQRLFAQLERLAATSSTVLIQGESGHRQGAGSAGFALQRPAPALPPLSPSTALRCPRGCWKASSLATPRGLSPGHR
ncbi:MAG: hypothetical protein KatS3mg131_1424 [Candidatus Tectimicrobiota bacterium]|nr:MAG: hypothetical protein KatS3mg131_1424 [Candidatus Tectomicrobia bacterium]